MGFTLVSGNLIVGPRHVSGDERQVGSSSVSAEVHAQYRTEEAHPAEVVVTGTLMRSGSGLALPILEISQDQLSRSGFASVRDALAMLPVAAGTAPAEDSTAQGNWNLGAGIGLRGLSSNATLLLVDGRRLPASGSQGAFVDVANVPLSFVDDIEVLPDSASAAYGSDAVAGVVNIKTRKVLNGQISQFRIGTGVGGVGERVVAHIAGDDEGAISWLGGYEFSQREALPAARRAFAGNADKRALGGADWRSIYTVPGNIVSSQTYLPVEGITLDEKGAGTTDAVFDKPIHRQNQMAVVDLLPDRVMHSAYGRIHAAIGETVALTGNIRVSSRKTSQTRQAFEALLYVPAANPFNSFGSDILLAYNFLNDLGPIEGRGETISASGYVDMDYQMGEGWLSTLSLNGGRERMRWHGLNTPSPSALQDALWRTDSEAFNAFGTGFSTSRHTLERIRSDQREGSMTTLDSARYVAEGPVVDDSSRLAFGAELRREGITPGTTPNEPSYKRSVESLFAELRASLFHNDRAPDKSLIEVALISRYDSYSDVGSTLNPSLILGWNASSFTRVRASWGTSFRAPTLLELRDLSGNASGLVTLVDPRSEGGSSLVLARQGAAAELREEMGRSYTVGADTVLSPELAMSLSYFVLDYSGRIVVPTVGSPFDVLLHEDLLGFVVDRNPTAEKIHAICSRMDFLGDPAACISAPIAAIVDLRRRNLASTRIRGLDVKFNGKWSSRLGVIKGEVLSNYLLETSQRIVPGAPAVNILDTAYNPLRLRARGTVDWDIQSADAGTFGTGLRLNYAGAYVESRQAGAAAVRDLLTVDLQFRYEEARPDGISGVLNISNIMDSDPPFLDRESGYDAGNADPYGRQISITISKIW